MLTEVVRGALSVAVFGFLISLPPLELVTGALSVAVAGFMNSLPPPEHVKLDSVSMVCLMESLIVFSLGLLHLYVFISGVRLPPVLARRLESAVAVGMANMLHSCQLLGNPKAKCIIPVSARSLP